MKLCENLKQSRWDAIDYVKTTFVYFVQQIKLEFNSKKTMLSQKWILMQLVNGLKWVKTECLTYETKIPDSECKNSPI